MPTHTTLSGHTIDYDRLSPKVSAFLKRLQEMLEDKRITEQEMIGLAYSLENPILDHTLFPGRGAVTKEVLADPVYHVITDLLARKHVATSGIDVDELADEHTVTVAAAAQELGITEAAVRQAIAARRLPSWLKGGKHYLSKRALRGFEASPRGPKREDNRSEAERQRDRRADATVRAVRAPASSDHRVEFVVGNADGKSFRIRYPKELAAVEREGPNLHKGILRDGWKRIAIIVGGGGDDRVWILEPHDGAEHVIEHGPFYIRGRFVEVERINNARDARAVWKAFEAA